MTEETDGGRVDRIVGRLRVIPRTNLNIGELVHAAADELERLRDDAERYRFLRDGENWPAVFGSASAPEPLRGWLLDEAVRLGMKSANKTPN